MRKRNSLRSAAVLAVLLVSGAAAAQTVIQADGWVKPDGSLAREAVYVTVRDGQVAEVSGTAPQGAAVQRFEGGILAPGMIDLSGGLAALGDRSEDANAMEPAARAADALDRYQDYAHRLAHAGVTAFAICPDDTTLIGGRLAAVHSVGPDGRPALLGAGPLHVSLSASVYRVDREPTSRTGALGLLRRTLRAATAGDQPEPLRAFAAGELAGLVTAPTAADVLATLRLADQMNLEVSLRHTVDGRDVAGLPGLRDMRVVVGPLSNYASDRDRHSAGALQRAGVRIALVGGYPNAGPDALRLSAAMAVRGGLGLDAARRAVSLVPAEVLGVADRLGAIEVGRQADLVVFSGDPLDLRSRVLAVYSAGRRLEEQAHD